MNRIIINEDKCKGCGLCVNACPKKIILLETKRLNKKGYNPAVFVKPEDCTACALCALMCPDVAIKVEKEDKK